MDISAPRDMGRDNVRGARAATHTTTPPSLDRTDIDGQDPFAVPSSHPAEFSQRQRIPFPTDVTSAPLAAKSTKIPSVAETADIPSAADSLESSGSGGQQDEQAEQDNEDFRAAMDDMRGGHSNCWNPRTNLNDRSR
jgi:hypothetical protein